MAYQSQPIDQVGNKKEVQTSDDDIQSLLTKILKELKIMNMHLSILTDEELKSKDI